MNGAQNNQETQKIISSQAFILPYRIPNAQRLSTLRLVGRAATPATAAAAESQKTRIVKLIFIVTMLQMQSNGMEEAC
jgi:hypothetical protein